METTPEPDIAAALAEMRREADTADPAARAAVAERLRTLLEQDFDAAFEGTHDWVLDPNDHLKEVACRALMLRDGDVDLTRARSLIGRAEQFIGSPCRPVARVASGVVLPYLLGLHPRIMPEWIRMWIANPDELVRVDVATALAALAPRFPTEAIDGLSSLAVDPRPRVRSGFDVAVRWIEQRQPKMAPYLRSRFPGRA